MGSIYGEPYNEGYNACFRGKEEANPYLIDTCSYSAWQAGSKRAREEIREDQHVMNDYWNCHEHRGELRVSKNATVFHMDHGQLCYGESHWDHVLWFPVRFKDRAAAAQWIREGCVAELQESFGNLCIGFTTVCLLDRTKDKDGQEEETQRLESL